jgi:hypothetical protein
MNTTTEAQLRQTEVSVAPRVLSKQGRIFIIGIWAAHGENGAHTFLLDVGWLCCQRGVFRMHLDLSQDKSAGAHGFSRVLELSARRTPRSDLRNSAIGLATDLVFVELHHDMEMNVLRSADVPWARLLPPAVCCAVMMAASSAATFSAMQISSQRCSSGTAF